MMARSMKCSNQRPDTLMQDRISHVDEKLLQRTAGPYIGVIHDRCGRSHASMSVRCAPKADKRADVLGRLKAF